VYVRFQRLRILKFMITERVRLIHPKHSWQFFDINCTLSAHMRQVIIAMDWTYFMCTTYTLMNQLHHIRSAEASCPLNYHQHENIDKLVSILLRQGAFQLLLPFGVRVGVFIFVFFQNCGYQIKSLLCRGLIEVFKHFYALLLSWRLKLIYPQSIYVVVLCSPFSVCHESSYTWDTFWSLLWFFQQLACDREARFLCWKFSVGIELF
jgi:hypothetical protein